MRNLILAAALAVVLEKTECVLLINNQHIVNLAQDAFSQVELHEDSPYEFIMAEKHNFDIGSIDMDHWFAQTFLDADKKGGNGPNENANERAHQNHEDRQGDDESVPAEEGDEVIAEEGDEVVAEEGDEEEVDDSASEHSESSCDSDHEDEPLVIDEIDGFDVLEPEEFVDPAPEVIEASTLDGITDETGSSDPEPTETSDPFPELAQKKGGKGPNENANERAHQNHEDRQGDEEEATDDADVILPEEFVDPAEEVIVATTLDGGDAVDDATEISPDDVEGGDNFVEPEPFVDPVPEVIEAESLDVVAVDTVVSDE